MFVLLPLAKARDYALIEISEFDYRLMARRLHTYNEMPLHLRPDKVLIDGTEEAFLGTHFSIETLKCKTGKLLKECASNRPLVYTEKPDWLVEGNSDITIRDQNGIWFPRYWVGPQAVDFSYGFALQNDQPALMTVRPYLSAIEHCLPYTVWQPADLQVQYIGDPRHYTVEIRHHCCSRRRGNTTEVSKHTIWAKSPEQMLEMFYRNHLRDDDCDGRVIADIPDSVIEADGMSSEILHVTAPDGADITAWFKEWARENLGMLD